MSEWDIERLRRAYATRVDLLSKEDVDYLAAYLATVDNFDIFDNRDEPAS